MAIPYNLLKAKPHLRRLIVPFILLTLFILAPWLLKPRTAPPTVKPALIDQYEHSTSYPSLNALIAQNDRVYRAAILETKDVPAPPGAIRADAFSGVMSSSEGAPSAVLKCVETLKGPVVQTIGPVAVGQTPGLFLNGQYLIMIKDATATAILLPLDGHDSYLTADSQVINSDNLLAAIRRIGPITATQFASIPLYIPGGRTLYPGCITVDATPDQSPEWINLTIPLTPHTESLAKTWLTSKDPARQFSAIDLLAHFPSKNNVKLIQRFLTSSFKLTTPEFDTGPSCFSPWTGSAYYPLRIAAVSALYQMGYPGNHPAITDPIPGWLRGWPLYSILLIPLILLCLLCKSVLNRLMIFCLAVSLLLAALFAHSYWRAHFFAFTIGSTYHEFTLHHGTLHVESLQYFPFSCPPAYTCARITPAISFATASDVTPWHEFRASPAVNVGNDSDLLGLSQAPFATTDPFDNFPAIPTSVYPAKTQNLPAWPILVLLPLIALPCLVGLFYRPFRRGYRMRHHLCLSCAYDLRSHAAGEKCPECGTVIPSILAKA